MKFFGSRWRVFLFLSVGLILSHFAFAEAPGPNSGNDPFAIFEFMVGLGQTAWYFIKIALLISGVIGLIFIVMGLLKIRAHGLDSQSGGHLKHGIILIILGGLLFGAPVLSMVVGNSLFGSAPAPVATQENVNCQMVNGEYNGGCGDPCAIAGQVQAANGAGTCACPGDEVVVGNACQCPAAGESLVNGHCQCTGASFLQGNACVLCPSGSGRSGGACVPCTVNQISSSGICEACPGNEINVNGVCACPPGDYQTVDDASQGDCQPCSSTPDNYGFYTGCPCDPSQNMYSNASPTPYEHCPAYPCPSAQQIYEGGVCQCAGVNSGLLNNVCVPCGSGSVQQGVCVCSPGYFMNASGCVPCGNADYGTQSACVCGSSTNTYAPTYPHCSVYPCQPEDYTASSQYCVCSQATPYPQYPHCPIICPQNQRLNGSGVCICSDSTQGLFQSACVNCVSGSVDPDTGACTCTNGSIFAGHGCVVCPPVGSGLVPQADGSCQCPSGQILSGDTCFCNEGTKTLHGGSCVPCTNEDYGQVATCPCGTDKFGDGNPAYPNCPWGQMTWSIPVPFNCTVGHSTKQDDDYYYIECCKSTHRVYSIPEGCFIEGTEGGGFTTTAVFCPGAIPNQPPLIPNAAPWTLSQTTQKNPNGIAAGTAWPYDGGYIKC